MTALVRKVAPHAGWFNLVLAYLVLDFGRVQEVFHFAFLRPLLIVVALLAGYILLRGTPYLFKTGQLKAIWLFIFLLGLHVPLARSRGNAFGTFKLMLTYMPFIISTVACVTTIDRLKRFIGTCLILMTFVATVAIINGGAGVGMYFSDENDLSLFINIWLPFSYFLFFQEKRKSFKALYLISLLIGLGTVVISFSRGGFLGMVAAIGFIWFISPRKLINLSFIVLLAAGVWFYAGTDYHEEMSTVTDTQDRTAMERILSWKAAWRMFLDHPMGVGGNNYQVTVHDYPNEMFNRNMWGRVAHSLWFTLIPEGGIPGMLIYFSLLAINIRDLFWIRKLKSSGLLGDKGGYLHALCLAFGAGLAAFFVSATFISVLYYAHYWYLSAMIAATKRVARSIALENMEAAQESTAPAPAQLPTS